MLIRKVNTLVMGQALTEGFIRCTFGGPSVDSTVDCPMESHVDSRPSSFRLAAARAWA